MMTLRKSERPFSYDWCCGFNKDAGITFLFISANQVWQQCLGQRQQRRRWRQRGRECKKEEGEESQSGEGEKREETTQRGETGQHLRILKRQPSFSLKRSLIPFLFFGLEKAERYRRPQEANECLHAVAELQPGANQVREPRNLRHRDIKEGRWDVETAGQRREGGGACRLQRTM